jgi:hypothetical protein
VTEVAYYELDERGLWRLRVHMPMRDGFVSQQMGEGDVLEFFYHDDIVGHKELIMRYPRQVVEGMAMRYSPATPPDWVDFPEVKAWADEGPIYGFEFDSQRVLVILRRLNLDPMITEIAVYAMEEGKFRLQLHMPVHHGDMRCGKEGEKLRFWTYNGSSDSKGTQLMFKPFKPYKRSEPPASASEEEVNRAEPTKAR